MILFFETGDYDLSKIDISLSQKIASTIGNGSINGVINIKHVGQLSTVLNGRIETVLFLPKIFLFSTNTDKGIKSLPFGLSNFSSSSPIYLTKDDVSFLEKDQQWTKGLFFKLSLWLYRSLDKYRKELKNTRIVDQGSVNEIVSSKHSDNESTLLEIILSLSDFLLNNQNLFVFIYKEANSGLNKVNWNKTVNNEFPLFDDENIIYPVVSNSRKGVNYDEQLMIIFFNTLKFINQEFGFDIRFDNNYNLRNEKAFSIDSKNGKIAKELLRIKGNYYNERLVHLWNLLYAFHKKVSDAKRGKMKDEFLLCSTFDRLFEKMVDSLASDTLSNKEQKELKEQKDDKTIDHLMKSSSVLNPDKEIYYVGDSKYYPDGESPHGHAMYKQFTYVRNIIQTQFDWYYSRLEGKQQYPEPLLYRDNLTGGYDISPNFFLSGKVRPKYDFEQSNLERERIVSNTKKGEEYLLSRQFDNRLFDRDTLFILQYSLNLFYLLKAYSVKSASMRNRFKTMLKQRVRKDLIETLNIKYDFFCLTPKEQQSIKSLLEQTFYWLNGRVYCIEANETHLVLALEKSSEVYYSEVDTCSYIIEKISHYFQIETYHLK